MKKNVIAYLTLIAFISTLLTQGALARGLVNPHGNFKWVSDYSKDKSEDGKLDIYGDYNVRSNGLLFSRKLGSYNFRFNYRDYIKEEDLHPVFTQYNFGTNLFPNSPLTLRLNRGKKTNEYKVDDISDLEDMNEPVDTIAKNSSAWLATPLPFGWRLIADLEKKQNYDVKRIETNEKGHNYTVKLNKNLTFGDFMNTKIKTKYKNLFDEDLIDNNQEEVTTRSISINNYLKDNSFYLSDIDGSYFITDEEDERDINYNLRTEWRPLDYLTTDFGYLKEIDQVQKENNSFETKGSRTKFNTHFDAEPYPILNLSGGLSKAYEEQKEGSDSNELEIDFNCELSYWNNFPLNFSINSEKEENFAQQTEEKISNNRNTELNLGSDFKLYNINFDFDILNKEKKINSKSRNSRYKSNALSLKSRFPKLYFGNFTLNSNYRHKIKWKSQTTDKDEEKKKIRNQGLGVGLSYQRYLTKNWYFRANTNFHSNLETFKYNPNYNLNLKYDGYGNLKLKLKLEGYHQDQEINDQGEVENEAEHYRNLNGEVSYSMSQSSVKLNLLRHNDFENDSVNTAINLKGSYFYRQIILNCETSWQQRKVKGDERTNSINITTSVNRYF